LYTIVPGLVKAMDKIKNLSTILLNVATKTGRHDIAEILLKVVLDTINQIKSLNVVMKKKFKNVFKDLRFVKHCGYLNLVKIRTILEHQENSWLVTLKCLTDNRNMFSLNLCPKGK
jgi:hypothetical protein